MKAQLSKRVTEWKLGGGLEGQIIPFHPPIDLSVGSGGTRQEECSDAIQSEQNVFKYYFRSFGREHMRLEYAAYAALWASSLLALLLAIWP